MANRAGAMSFTNRPRCAASIVTYSCRQSTIHFRSNKKAGPKLDRLENK
jgi:hypothetical protein